MTSGLASTMAEMQEFYDAGMARLEDVMVYVDARFPLNEMPDDAKALMHLMQSLVMVSVPDRGVEATARARQRRCLHPTASRSRWSDRVCSSRKRLIDAPSKQRVCSTSTQARSSGPASFAVDG